VQCVTCCDTARHVDDPDFHLCRDVALTAVLHCVCMMFKLCKAVGF